MKQTLNNGETHGAIRAKINDNFNELYDGLDAKVDKADGKALFSTTHAAELTGGEETSLHKHAAADVNLGDGTVETELSSHTLKIATLDKSLTDFADTLSQVNVNQEAKQTATGVETVSLPKNAANGHMGYKVEGLTASNLVANGNFVNTTGWTPTFSTISAANNILSITGNGANKTFYAAQNKTFVAGNKYYGRVIVRVTNTVATNIMIRLASGYGDITQPTPTENIWYTLSNVFITTTGGSFINYCSATYADAATTNGKVTECKCFLCIDLTATFGSGNEPDLATCDKMFTNWFDGTKSTTSARRIRSVSGTQSSSLYISDAGVLRSNGETADDITDGVKTQRIDEDGSALAEPIISNVQTSGTLLSYPSGTVYCEKAIADAGIYTDKMTVLNTNYPIAALERIVKIDFATGVETEINVSTAVVAGDKLSFTHPDLAEGDIVFFTYFYDNESTEGEMTVEYYDSRYVIKNADNNKFYKWAVKVSGTDPVVSSIDLVEV